MEKQSLEPIELLKIATQHAYAAEHLLKQNAEVEIDHNLNIDVLLPITSLMYLAFELTLKAYIIHEHRPIKHHKSLLELIELNSQIDLSTQDIQLLKQLSRQQAFRKGIEYELWESRQQQQIFCEKIMVLYAQIQELMPLELHYDYQ